MFGVPNHLLLSGLSCPIPLLAGASVALMAAANTVVENTSLVIFPSAADVA